MLDTALNLDTRLQATGHLRLKVLQAWRVNDNWLVSLTCDDACHELVRIDQLSCDAPLAHIPVLTNAWIVRCNAEAGTAACKLAASQ